LSASAVKHVVPIGRSLGAIRHRHLEQRLEILPHIELLSLRLMNTATGLALLLALPGLLGRTCRKARLILGLVRIHRLVGGLCRRVSLRSIRFRRISLGFSGFAARALQLRASPFRPWRYGLDVSGSLRPALSAVTTRSSGLAASATSTGFSAGLAAASLSGFAVSLAAVVSFGASEEDAAAVLSGFAVSALGFGIGLSSHRALSYLPCFVRLRGRTCGRRGIVITALLDVSRPWCASALPGRLGLVVTDVEAARDWPRSA